MLAPDLLHAARALRAPHDRRQGPQAQGGPDRAPRDAGRRAVHPVLALRALLRHDHEDGRARDLQPGRPLGAGPVPGDGARQRLLGQRRRHLPGRRAHRPGLPVPGPRLVPRPCEVDLSGLRARLQHRGAHEHQADPPRRGPPGRPAQAALQRGRQPLVDLRRGPLRLRRGGRADPDRASRAPGGRRRAPPVVGRGRGRAGGRTARGAPGGHRRAALLADDERGPLGRPAPVRGHAGRGSRRLPGAGPRAGLGGRPPAGGRQVAEHPGCRADRLRAGGRRRRPARPRCGAGRPAPAPLGVRPRPPRVGLARGGRGGRARARRGRGFPGADGQPDERPGPPRPPERGVRGARGNLDERGRPGPAVLARRPAPGRGPAGLGDPRGRRPRPRPRLAAAPCGAPLP